MVADKHSKALETLVARHEDCRAGCSLYDIGEGGGEYGGKERGQAEFGKSRGQRIGGWDDWTCDEVDDGIVDLDYVRHTKLGVNSGDQEIRLTVVLNSPNSTKPDLCLLGHGVGVRNLDINHLASAIQARLLQLRFE